MTNGPSDLTPSFSFVIPTFDRANLVVRAVSSVLDQTGGDLEVIVVDDGSTDETPHAMAELKDPRLQYLRLDRAGATVARNHGAEHARGEFLVFLDSDDELLPTWSDSLSGALTSDIGVVSCDSWRQTAVDERERRGAWDLSYVVSGSRALFQSGTYAVDRAAFHAVGGFDAELVSGHHTDLCFRLLPWLESSRRQVVHLDVPLVVHHLGAPHSIRRNDRVILEGTEQLIERHGALLEQTPRLLSNYHGVAGVSAARLGQAGRARQHFRMAIRYEPNNLGGWLRLLAASLPGGRRVWLR